MDLRNQVTVITGAASGIGAALAARLDAEQPRHLVLVDLTAPEQTARNLTSPCTNVACDVSDRASVHRVIADTVADHGHIDLYCSNAGIATGMGVEAPDEVWDRIWAVNVKAAVYAAQALLATVTPQRRTRLMITASAAGLLTNLGDAPYTATKHAAVGLAEWIAITYGESGLDAACLCPQGVRTPMVTGGLDERMLGAEVVEAMGLIEPADCADAAVAGLRDDRFLILPHPEVAEFQRRKATDPDRWIAGMRKLQRRLTGG